MANHLLPVRSLNLDALPAAPRARLRFTSRGWYRFGFRWISYAGSEPAEVWCGPFASYGEALAANV